MMAWWRSVWTETCCHSWIKTWLCLPVLWRFVVSSQTQRMASVNWSCTYSRGWLAIRWVGRCEQQHFLFRIWTPVSTRGPKPPGTWRYCLYESEGFDTAVIWLGSGCSCFGKRSACICRVQDESQFELDLLLMCRISEVSAALHLNTVLFSTVFGLFWFVGG